MNTETNLVGIRQGHVIAAIVYYREGRKRVWAPHSVFTTEPGSGRFSEYDLCYSRARVVVCVNESGCGGSVYLHPLANRSGRDAAFWWNRALVSPVDGRTIGGKVLKESTIRKWGYQVPVAPLPLMGTTHVNPLHSEERYWTQESKAVWCKHCRSFLPDQSEAPCDHLTWDDENSDFRYVRTCRRVAA